jgi:hypothetical protein
MLLTSCLVALVFFFVAIFYALRPKGYVRATFKGPFGAFLFEFEADDGRRTPK